MAELRNTEILGWLKVLGGFIYGHLLETETVLADNITNVDLNNGPRQIVSFTSSGTFNMTPSNFPASGTSAAITLLVNFTVDPSTITIDWSGFSPVNIPLTPDDALNGGFAKYTIDYMNGGHMIHLVDAG